MDQTTLAASLTIIGTALNASSQISWISGAYFVYVYPKESISRALIESADSEVKYVHLVSASLWSTFGCLVTQAGPASWLGRLLCRLVSSLARSDVSTTHHFSGHHRGGRRRTHDYSPDDCERCSYFERTREVSRHLGKFCSLFKGFGLM